jgi:hypothetical protein
MGGLIGYWFDQLIVQVYVTSDVYEKNYGGIDVRGWAIIIVPIGDPHGPTPKATPIAH